MNNELTIIFARIPSSCASTSIVALSVSCRPFQVRRGKINGGTVITISRRTSPAEKASPSFFFQDAIPPSVMVGLMAGILKGASARRRAET